MAEITNFQERLKVVVSNRKKRQEKTHKRGKNAIDKIKAYNTIAEKLLTIGEDLHSPMTEQTLDYADWFLEEFIESEPSNSSPIEAVLYTYAIHLRISVGQKLLEMLTKEKKLKPKPTAPNKPPKKGKPIPPTDN